MDINSFRIRMKDRNGVHIDGEAVLFKGKKGRYSLVTDAVKDIVEFSSLEDAFAYVLKGESIESRVSVWKEFPPIILDAPSNWYETWLETQKEQ